MITAKIVDDGDRRNGVYFRVVVDDDSENGV